MSRPISYTSAVTVNIASFSGMTGSVSSGTSYPPSNGINSSANTTNYAAFSGTSNSSSGYVYYKFAALSIPADATINSVSCVAVGRVSNASRCYGAFQLMAGSTAKGSATSFNTTSVSACTLTPGTWTLSELQNIALRITVRRASTQAGSARFYGATLTINYSVQETEYEISISNSTTITTNPTTGTTYVSQGEDQEIKFNTTDVSNITVTDNGNQITPVIVSGGSASFSLTEYDSTSSSASTSSTNMANGATGTGSTTYATLYGGRNATYYYYYNFSITGIPQDATIQQLSLSVKGCRYSTYGWNAILCKGTTEVDSVSITASGSSTNSGGTPMVDVLTSTNFGVSDLPNIKLKLKPTQGSNNSRLFFYGADLVITYTVDNVYYVYTISNISADHTIVIINAFTNKLYARTSTGWVEMQKIYKKINNVWLEQTPDVSIFDSTQRYIRNNQTQ